MNKLDLLKKSKVLKKYLQKTIYKEVYVSEKMVITDGRFLLILNGVSSKKPVLIDFFTGEINENTETFPNWKYLIESLEKNFVLTKRKHWNFMSQLSELLSHFKLSYSVDEIVKIELVNTEACITKIQMNDFIFTLEKPITFIDFEEKIQYEKMFPLYIQFGFLALLEELHKLGIFVVDTVSFIDNQSAIKFSSFTNNVLYLMPMRVSEMDF